MLLESGEPVTFRICRCTVDDLFSIKNGFGLQAPVVRVAGHFLSWKRYV
jgi:hypothetical protein